MMITQRPAALSCLLVVLFFLATLSSTTATAKPRYVKTTENYTIPDVTLVNQNGQEVRLVDYLETDQPLLLEFIFATCTTICPILSIGFTNLQGQLGPEAAKVRLVSISIDPEHDTPPVMKAYLQRYNAQPGWDFLTGKVDDIAVTMRAFDAFVSDKMGHRPLTFLKAGKGKPWVRIDGLMSGKELKNEYLQLKR